MKIPSSNPGRRSGIDDLMEQPPLRSGAPCCIAVDRATLLKYKSRPVMGLWQLVLLHSRVDPDHLEYIGFQNLIDELRAVNAGTAVDRQPPGRPCKHSPTETLYRNAIRAENALISSELKSWRAESNPGPWSDVEVSSFRAWSLKVHLPAAGPWPQRSAMDGRRGVALRLPHLTRLLQQMAALAWSARAGRSQVGWPTNEQIADLAVGDGISQHLGEAMASLLRPDDLPRGRRTRAQTL